MRWSKDVSWTRLHPAVAHHNRVQTPLRPTAAATGTRIMGVMPAATQARAGAGNREERGGRDDRRVPYFDPGRGAEPDFSAYQWEHFVRLIDELEERLPFVGGAVLGQQGPGPAQLWN